mgnify:CR=1 FL=1
MIEIREADPDKALRFFDEELGAVFLEGPVVQGLYRAAEHDGWEYL